MYSARLSKGIQLITNITIALMFVLGSVNIQDVHGAGYSTASNSSGLKTSAPALDSTEAEEAVQIVQGETTWVSMDKNGIPRGFHLTLSVKEEGPFTWKISSQASHGTASVESGAQSAAVHYYPQKNFLGSDSFKVMVLSPSNNSDEITVYVSVEESEQEKDHAFIEAQNSSLGQQTNKFVTELPADMKQLSMAETGNQVTFSTIKPQVDINAIFPDVLIPQNTQTEVFAGDSMGDLAAMDASPYILVELSSQRITAIGWDTGTEVTLTIDNPGNGVGVDYTQTGTIVNDGAKNYFLFDWPSGGIEPGAVVAVAGGEYTRQITVNLSVTDFDPDHDKISGTTTPNNSLVVNAWDGAAYIDQSMNADGSGNWTTDFSTGENSLDLLPNMTGKVIYYDLDANIVTTSWTIPNPTLEVESKTLVHGWNWPEGASVTLSVDYSSNGSGVDYTDTKTAETSGSDTYLSFSLGAELSNGDIVSLSDGKTTKSVTVKDLAITSVALSGDLISGTAEAGSSLKVWAYASDSSSSSSSLDVTTGLDGKWTADFSSVLDLTINSYGGVAQYDSDGDAIFTRFDLIQPYIDANKDTNIIKGVDWMVGKKTFTLTIDDPSAGSGIDYQDTYSIDTEESLNSYVSIEFVLSNFTLASGQIVTMTDGDTTRTLVISSVAVTDVNAVANTVSGTATAGKSVKVFDCISSTCSASTVTTGSGGKWTTNFSDLSFTVDITPDSSGYVSEMDDDGDLTTRNWNYITPLIQVHLNSNGLTAVNWPAGETVSIAIDDPSNGTGTDYTNSIVIDGSEPSGYYDIPVSGFTLAAGQIVTMTDGADTKSLVITPLTIDSFDTELDTVAGTATASTYINLWACNGSDCASGVSLANASGDWSMDYAGITAPFDLKKGTNVLISQSDDDGDSTWNAKTLPDPYIQVAPYSSSITTYGWWVNDPLTVKIDDPDNGVGVDYQDTGVATKDEWGNIGDSFTTTGFTLKAGQVITITNGQMTISYTILALSINSVNEADDQVAGSGSPNGSIDGWACNDNTCGHASTTADDSGDWALDFSSADTPIDLKLGTRIYVNQSFDNKNRTESYKYLQNPHFTVFPDWEQAEGWEFTLGSTVTVTIDDPTNGVGVDYTGTAPVTGSSVEYSYFLIDFSGFDLKPGQTVKVTDGFSTVSYTVSDVTLTAVDRESDTATGTADAGTTVFAKVCIVDCSERYVTTDSGGTWLADFSATSSDPFNVTYGTWAKADQRDSAGNATEVQLYIDIPVIRASTTKNKISGYNWPLSDSVTLTIDDPSNGTGTDYTSTKTVVSGDDGKSSLEFDLGKFTLSPGQIVKLEDDEITKSLTVTDVQITEVNSDADTFSGNADAGVSIEVYACASGTCKNQIITVGSDGTWLADFSSGSNKVDIDYYSWGSAQQLDSDLDYTASEFSIPAPAIGAYIRTNEVRGWDWKSGSSLTMTIDDPSNGEGVDYTDTEVVTKHGADGNYADFALTDFDLTAGQVITITDGITSRTHTIFNLAVSAIDLAADTVSGTAEGLSTVNIHGCADQTEVSCSDRELYAAANGTWTEDFSTGTDPLDLTKISTGWVKQWDKEANFTRYDWRVYQPLITVVKNLDQITLTDWPYGSTLTYTIDDPENGVGVDYTNSVVVGGTPEDPISIFTLSGFEIKSGQELSATDGSTTRSLEISSLQVDTVDQLSDVVTGSTEASSAVHAWACDSAGENCVYKDITASTEGIWSADYSKGDVFDINGDSLGGAEQYDSDGDITRVTWSSTPYPSIDSIDPTEVYAGSAGFTLSVTGSNFKNSSVIRWNGHDRSTTYVDSQHLTATISTEDIADGGDTSITVFNPGMGGGVSNSKTFSVLGFSPANGQKLAANKVTFDWSDYSGAIGYGLQLSLSNTFTTTLVNTTVTSSNFSYGTVLTNGRTYYWRIRPKLGATTWGDWTAARMFYSMNPPVAPVLLLPANLGLTNTTTPTFTWNSVANGNTYHIQISKATSFGTLEQNVTLGTGILTYSAESLAEGTHYWRVQAIDSVGVSGTWSGYRSFTVDTVAPVVPALLTPSAGAIVQTTIPSFTVKAVTGAKYYQIQINTSDDFATPLLDMTKTSTSFALTTAQALPFGTIYWRTRATDAAGNNSDWSSTNTFVVNILKGPANNSYTLDKTPTFSWGAAAGALEYKLQVDNNADFSSPEIDLNRPVSTSYTPLTDLAFDHYQYRMQVRTASGWSNWTPAYTFTVTPTPPVPPVLQAPVNGYITNDATPEFTWLSAVNGVRYEIQISKSTSFTTTEKDVYLPDGVLAYTSTTLVDGIHYWRVRSINSLDIPGAWSGYRSLTVDTLPPAVPVVNSPKVGAIVQTTIPTIVVNAVAGTKYYQIQINTSDDFATPLLDFTKTSTSFTLTSAQALPFGTIYWRTRATDAAGNNSDWSSTNNFVVNILKGPTNNSYTLDKTPTFSWGAAAGALEYKLQVDNNADFSSPEIDLNRPVSTSYTPLTDLAFDHYQYRMQVRTASGWSNWTPAYTFTVTPTPPVPPVLQAPVNGYITNDATPEFTWLSAVNGVRYEIQISKSTSFTTTEKDVYLPDGVLAYTSTTLVDGIHYWRVRSINSLDIPGAWSGYRSLTVDTLPPAVPVVNSPKVGAIVQTTIPTIVVNAVAGTKYYQIQINTSDDFATPLLDFTKTSTSFTLTSAQALPFGTIYWRTRATDAAGNNSDWSSTNNFVVNILKGPTNNSYTLDKTPTFSWGAAAGALEYKLQVDNNADFSSPEIDLNRPVSTSYTPLTDLDFGPYVYRMQVRTTTGWSNWTPVISFTITPALPVAPVLSSPGGGAISSVSTPTFTWIAVGTNTKYQIWISRSTSFSVLSQDKTVSDLSLIADELSNGVYYWKVRAINQYDIPGAWSAYRKLTVNVTTP